MPGSQSIVYSAISVPKRVRSACHRPLGSFTTFTSSLSARYLLGLVNPYTVVAAAIAGAALAYHAGAEETVAYNKALILSGNAAGATSDQLAQYARNISQVTGTQGAAAAAVVAVAQSGAVTSENLQRAAQAALAFEKATGTAIDTTVKHFQELAKSPLEATLKLNEGMNFLTVSVYEQIKALQEQGKSTEAANLAQKTYADTLSSRSAEILKNVGFIEERWLAVMAAIQNARDVLLQATSPRINPVPVVGTVDLSNTSQVLNNLPSHTRVTGVTNLATQSNLAYGGGFLTGFGSLAPLSSVGLASGQVTGNLPSYTRVTGLTDIATQAQLSLTGGYLTGFGTFAALNSINLTDATKVLGNLANARVAGLGALALLASLDLGSSTYVVGALAANRIAAGALAVGVTYSDFIYADQVMAGEVAIGNSNVRLELGGTDTPNVAVYVRRNTGAAVPGASISFRDNAAIGGIGPFMYFDANGRNYALQIDDGGNNSDPAAPALLFIDGQNRHCAGYQQIIEGGRNDGQL